jgi:hypothetical protein
MSKDTFDKLAKRIEKFRCDKRDGKLVDHEALASLKGVKKELDREKQDDKTKAAQAKEQKKELSPQECMLVCGLGWVGLGWVVFLWCEHVRECVKS